MKKIFSDGMRAAMHKLKLLFTDHFQLLFKSSADNHLRIQQCQADKSGKIVCSLSFNSYSDLKKYQKKFRTATVSLSSALAMVLIAAMVSPLVFNPSRSGAANYSWKQTDWQGGASTDVASHPNDSIESWTNFSSQDGLDLSVAGEVKLELQNGNTAQTSDTDFSAGTFDQTEVSGSGDGASVKLTTSASLDTGDGTDGALNVTGTFNINSQTNEYGGRTCADGVVYNVTSLGANSVNLASNPTVGGCLNPGDMVMLINLQGAGSFGSNVGNYEFLTIQSTGTFSATFTTNKTKCYGRDAGTAPSCPNETTTYVGTTTGKQRVIMQRIPQYSDVTVQGGGTLTADAWGGVKGGALAFYANGTVDVRSGGKIDMTGKGYRGGAGGLCSGAPGTQGESYRGVGAVSSNNNLGGGGGGTEECHIYWSTAGGGGYGTNGEYGTVNEGYAPGTGGAAYGSADLSKIFMGSAGGGMDNLSGGNGGGISYIVGNKFIVSDSISAEGVGGTYQGSGAGGSIYLVGGEFDIGNSLVMAKGGVSTMGGGNGGDGRIHLKSNDAPALTTPEAYTSTPEIAYNPAGTFTSGSIDTGQRNPSWGNLSWTNSTQTIKVQIATNNDNSTWNFVGPDGTDQTWYLTGTGEQISAHHNGNRYLRYKAELSTDVDSQTPSLEDITFNFSYYPTSPKSLVSSIFNTTDKYTSISNLTWNATADTTEGEVKFQIKSADSEANLATASWCGPETCDATAGVADFYTTKAGNEINGDQVDHNNKYLQYAAFLSSADGTATPVLEDVTVHFSYNNPPSVEITGASQQSDGKIRVDYTLQETETTPGSEIYEQDDAYALLFYQLDDIKLAQQVELTGEADILLSNPNNVPIPSSGKVLIEKELISYTSQSSNTTLSGITRSANFYQDSHLTESAQHAIDMPVYFLATSANVSGQISNASGAGSLPSTNSEVTYTADWDAKNELGLSAATYENVKVKIAANDNDSYGNRVGGAVSGSLTVDYQAPTITSVSTTKDPGKYKAGTEIPLVVTFSENVNFDSTGGKTVTLTLNSGTCTIASSVVNSSTVNCTYSVGSDENTPEGEYLKVNSISTTGTISDVFSNPQTDFSIPAGQNIDENGTRQITIDTVPPVISGVAPSANAFINSTTSAKGGSDVSYTLDENLQSGSITFTRTGGATDDNPHVCTLQGTALNSGSYDNFELTQGANSCQEEQSTLVSGTVYTMRISATDIAGNVTTEDRTGITFDTTPPTMALRYLEKNMDFQNGDFINSVGRDGEISDISYSINENLLDLADGGNTYIKFIKASGADSEAERICTLSGTELSAGDHDNVDLDQKCSLSLVHDTVYNIEFSAKDLAGNQSDTQTVSGVTYDEVGPELLSFSSPDSPTENENLSEPYTVFGDLHPITIVATYGETIKQGSTMRIRMDVTETSEDAYVNLSAPSDGTTLTGTFTVRATPGRTFDTSDLNVGQIDSESVKDLAGNEQTQSDIQSISGENLANNNNIVIDTGGPILQSFGATSGSFNSGNITITANYSEKLKADGSVDVKIVTNNPGDGDTQTVNLSSISQSETSISGTYGIQAGDNVQALTITAVENENIQDKINNPAATDNGNLPGGGIVNGTQIDTTPPQLGSDPISSPVSKTQNPVVSFALDASDKFDLSDGFVEFSLDAGLSGWCEKPYASTVQFDITDGNCGGINEDGDKTVTVRFKDAAGNISADSAQETVNLDRLAPVLQKFTVESASGKIGPQQPIKLIAKYGEEISSTQNHSIEVELNNGARVTLQTLEGTDTLTGTYTTPATMNNQDNPFDVDALAVESVIHEEVSDVSDPMNTRVIDNPSIAGVNNIGEAAFGYEAKDIEIDATAPRGSIAENLAVVLDRSESENSGLISLGATDSNGVNMQMEVIQLDSDTSCDFTGTWENFATSKNLSTNDSSIKKVCVKFKDDLGNESMIYSAVAPQAPEDVSYMDITNLEVTPPFRGIFILWPTPSYAGSGGFARYDLKTCQVSKDDADCVPNSDLADISDPNVNYFMDHEGLSEENKHCYRLRFKDLDGNFSKFSQTSCTVPSQGEVLSNTAVEIQDISIGAETNNSATVSFRTLNAGDNNDPHNPLPTTATVQVFSDEALTQQVGPDFTEGFGISHIVKMTNLSSSFTYYLKITATDTIGSTKTLSYGTQGDPDTDPGLVFSTTGALSTITLISDDVTTNNKAVIEFRTDQAANCSITYKKPDDTSNEGEKPEAIGSYSKNHTITLTDILNSDTMYDYTITCLDIALNMATLSDQFKTSDKQFSQGDLEGTAGDSTAPEISAVSISEITGEKAVITWNTNEKANSSVIYNMDGSDFSRMESNPAVNSSVLNYTTAHSVILNGLIPASKYVFSVVSSDVAGNISNSSQITLTTKEPSSLSSVKVISKALNQATISWETGDETTSIVEYGLTTAYGETKESNSRTKTHELTISDLQSGQTYHFRVKGEDADGNLFASNDNTFEPKSPPRISDFKIDEITEHGAKITFTTNVPTDALVEYTDALNEENSGFQGRPDFATRHEVILRGLSSGTEFGLKLKVRDEDGNETEEIFQSFATSTDENAPKIEQVRTDSALAQNDKVQAIISWKTDENANTKLVYKEGKAGKETEVNVSDVMTTSHIAVITSFKPGTVYYFNAISVDASGNEAKSGDFALLTPKRKENIIQIIVNNFQDIFGWAQR